MPDTLANEISDCHLHVVGPSDAFPQVEGRAYTAGPAPLENLRAVAEPAGVTRYVLVQPSFYGTDNSYLLQTLDSLQERGRGVVVLESDAISARLLDQLQQRGVCGVRLNLYSKFSAMGPGRLEDILRRFISKMPRAGWHIEMIAALATIAGAASVIADSTIPIVIDHYGLPGNEGPEGALGRSLLDLLSLPQVWIKLSAPYRVVEDPLATNPPAPWLSALLRVAPDRCVWGSDWPHAPQRRDQTDARTSVPYRLLDYWRVLGDFIRALPDATVADRIFRLNPDRLYGFRTGEEGGTQTENRAKNR
jgi:predicted TIM-barrel fold metal-dependent hydrolase